MPTKKIFTENEIEQIIELYENDLTTLEISKKFNCSVVPIKNVLKKMNKMRPFVFTHIKHQTYLNLSDKEQFILAYGLYPRLNDLAEYYNCGLNVLRSTFKYHNLSIRSRSESLWIINHNPYALELTVENIIEQNVNNRIKISDLPKLFNRSMNFILKFVKEHDIKLVNNNTDLQKYGIQLFNDNNIEEILNIRNNSIDVEDFCQKLELDDERLKPLCIQHNIPWFTTSETKTQQYNSKIENQYYNYTILKREGKYFTLKHNKCGKVMTCSHQLFRVYAQDQDKLCTRCNNRHYSSGAENAIQTFLSTLTDLEFTANTRKVVWPKEIDIYIESHNLAIEFCGLYYHSEEMGKKPEYHVSKYDKCKNKGIKLITIFEDEWNDNSKIVKSKILHSLSLTDNKIYARKCCVTHLGTKEANKFLNAYHIHGAFCKSKINIGLKYNNELVAVMSFTRINNSGSVELTRYITNATIVGGFTKCFKYFERNYNFNKVISYSDLRWGDGVVHEKAGFKFSHKTEPTYWYVDTSPPVSKHHRSNFTKKKLDKLYPHLSHLPEREIMKELKYKTVWDCGSNVYVYEK